ncbi:DUF6371 domain-containing protein [Hymenobacter psychrotolerans]|uniref:DUF927 domain-containing protein n=1 Tax=Hymenobacter psychrotolerans DSM 18569 TaxID=1121959 RepID=A0A1M6Z978_9BACT|nr:DUF6371 domain-containing protein [Hymenobacter psychrotolerans]SHL27028.1 hypothetical protein SAMN02746009_02463 [Hymenobacter psychrotolerans DSM 18569]
MSARYSLEKHPKPKGTCPNCSQKKVFRFFQDQDGNRLDEQYGICDRQAKCGYDHRPSGELFTATGTAADAPEAETLKPAADVAATLLAKTKDHSSNLHKYARTLTIPAEHLEKWAVATDRDRTVFLHLNGEKQLVNAKWFKYTEDGRRDKLTQPYSFASTDEEKKKSARYAFCLFGEHLLRHDNPERPICVVESEKSAVLASFFYPHLDWVACGAANGITDEKISALFNRPIWWLADADGNVPKLKDGQPEMRNGKQVLTEGGRNNSSLRKLKSYKQDFVVIDLFPERHDGYDIADALRDGVRPDIVAPAKPKFEAKAKKAKELPVLPADVDNWSVQMKDYWYKANLFIEEFERRGIWIGKNDEDWENTANSLAIFREHGRELLHRLARPEKTYSKQDVDALFDEALQNAICSSPAKFFAIGKHYNIQLSDLKEKVSEEDELRSMLPKGVSPEDYFKHGFYEHDNAYYSVTKDGPKMVCGFTIKVLYLVKSKDNPKRIVELKNQYGYTTTLDLPTDAFVGLGAFKKYVESVGNFVFEGNETDLTRLKKKLFREEKVTTEITTLGWHERGQFYAFSNGIFNSKWTKTDEYGIVEHDGLNYFLPFFSGINDDHNAYINEKKFSHKDSSVKFEGWADLIYKVYGLNGAIGMCFYISSLFRDYIFEAHNSFPMLYAFGQRQSGKSVFADSFKHLFGTPQDSISLENPSTVIGVIRTLANFTNSIVMLDEYKNSVDKKTVGMLKGFYDGFGRTTGVKSNDNQTKVTKPRSAVWISGQDMPNIDNALFTRTILLEFLAGDRDYESFDRLKKMQEKSLTSITLEVLRHRADIVKWYKDFFKVVRDNLRQLMAKHKVDVEDRMIQNMAIILTPTLYLLEANLLKFPFDVDTLYDMAVQIILRQHQQISQSTDSRRFWDVFVGLVSHKPMPLIIEGQDYRFYKGNLYIRLGNVHPPYMQQHRNQYNVPGLDKTTLDYYLKNDPAFLEKKDLRFDMPAGSPVLKTNPTSCYGFKFDELGIDLTSSAGDVMTQDIE